MNFPIWSLLLPMLNLSLWVGIKKRIIYSFGWLLSTIILFLLTHALIRLYSAKNSLEEKNGELQRALEEIKTLEGIVPICSFCKKNSR